ncbi:MAG: serine--tRNA ligase [Phycisphaerae bacterium]|jgi:seryl-tRNA synthetase|nr:serine--tRNA ligase [Phycisphaerae bacterium]
MLDIQLIRNDPETVKRGLSRKGSDADVDGLLALDGQRRRLISQRDDLRRQRNAISKDIGKKKQGGGDADKLMAESREIGEKIKRLEAGVTELDASLQDALLLIPNLPADDAPEGIEPENNREVKRWGEVPRMDFEPLPHWELGPLLDVIDFERAAKISGAGFSLYTGLGSRLVRGLLNFMLDVHTSEHGFTEVFPPFLVKREAMVGTGQLPKFEEELYALRDDPLYLIPTAEVPVTNIYRDEILPAEALPICLAAYTACFRREAGAAGRETRGIIRVHQFNKVELVKFARPETSRDELESLTLAAENILERLGIAYRRLELCCGDMSLAAAKCYDLEIYSVGCRRWLEVSSCSNFADFQARRARIRYRGEDGQVKFVHTLNGSGVALPRLVIAILENFQQRDGSVVLPEAIRPYMGGLEAITPPKQ